MKMKNLFLRSNKIKPVTLALFCLFVTLQSLAQSSIEDVDVRTGDNGSVVIDFKFNNGVIQPEVFSTNLPPRLALDFTNTDNVSNIRNMAVGKGSAKGLRVVSSGNKTRVVIDLLNQTTHEITTINDTLSLKLMNNRVVRNQASNNRVNVELVDFRRGVNGQGIVQVELSGPDAVINYSESLGMVSIDIANSNLVESMDKKLDVIDFATPVTYVDSRQTGGAVKIDIEVSGPYEKVVYQTGSQYTVEINELVEDAANNSKLIDDTPVYTGNKVSFNFQDIPVRSVIQLIADASQLNIVVADNVEGNVTLRLNEVPWDQALDIVLQSKQLDQRRRGDVIWVAPAAEIAQREQEKLEALSQKQELEPLDNIFIQVNYAKAEELAMLINGDTSSEGSSSSSNSLLSERGSVAFDERTNMLLVTDVPDRLRVIQDLVDNLDRSVQQVQIETRIVVATERFADELGVRFGVTGSHEDKYGNIISTGGSASAVDRLNNAALNRRYTSPSGSGVPTITPDPQFDANIPGPPLGERLNVNLPAASSTAGRWAASILAADFLLDLELSALETEDRGEVISSPRVITANQSQAVIRQGVQIPYEQATSSGATSITFRDAVLSLDVVPLITPDDRVDLTLVVDQDAIGEEVSTSLGGSVPSIDTRSVETRVLVNNGQTVVLGGIYEQIRRTTKSKIPVLGDIPGIGGLFRNKAVQDDKAELLIFVTPTIIKDSL